MVNLGTSLGTHLGVSLAGAASLFAQVLALAQGRPVFTADYFAIDGVSGKVAAFIDWNDPTHRLEQTVSVRQVPVPTAQAGFAGAQCATFTNIEVYTSTRAGSYWQMARGGNVEHWLGFSASVASVSVLEVTGSFEETSVRQQLDVGAAAGLLRVAVGTVSVADAFEVGVPMCCGFRHAGTTLDLFVRGALRASGTDAPVVTPPSIGLQLGGYPGSGYGASMRWPFSVWLPPLTPESRATVLQWIATFGLATS